MTPYDKAAIYLGGDGVAKIVSTSKESIEKYGEARVFGAAVPEGVDFEIVPTTDIDAMYAAHGDYRDAWSTNITTPSGQGSSANVPWEV